MEAVVGQPAPDWLVVETQLDGVVHGGTGYARGIAFLTQCGRVFSLAAPLHLPSARSVSTVLTEASTAP